MPGEASGGARPRFSVVVPTLDRPDRLSRCLRAIADLDYPHQDFEVVVVDDGGTLPLEPAIEPFRGSIAVRVVRRPNGGPGAARNTGARNAHGTYLAFTDDDCRPRPDWLRSFERAHQAHPHAMLGGCIQNSVEENAFATTDQVITDLVNDFFNARDPNHARLIISNNVSVATDDFLAAGGFDESFHVAAEDREISQRWRSQGRELIFWPEAVAYHEHRTTLGQFVRQHFRYGRGAAHFKRACDRRNVPREYRDFLFHRTLGRRVLRSLAALPARKRPSVVLLLGVWQAVYAAGFVYELVRRRAPS